MSPARGPFAGLFRLKLDALAFTQELEHRTANGEPMEEVPDASLVTNESEPLVDEQTRDGPVWHTHVLRSTKPPGTSPGRHAAENGTADAAGPSPCALSEHLLHSTNRPAADRRKGASVEPEIRESVGELPTRSQKK